MYQYALPPQPPTTPASDVTSTLEEVDLESILSELLCDPPAISLKAQTESLPGLHLSLRADNVPPGFMSNEADASG